MDREGAHAGVRAERVELHGEQHVGGLRLAVRLPLVVAALELRIVPANARAAVPAGRDGDDARPAAGERRPEAVDEREVAEVIGRELRLPARGRRASPGKP